MAVKARASKIVRTVASASPPSSRERLLDAGERLFAEHGYDGVALRAIADAAKVNHGTIPYFFGTKEKLFKEVMLRRIEPVQRERRMRLQALLDAAKEMTIEKVLAALLEPVFRDSGEYAAFRKLAGRCATDPAPEVRQVMDEIYDVSTLLTPKALRVLCPDLQADDFYWRLTCLYGAMFYIQADTGRMQTIAGRQFDTSRPATALAYLIPAFAAFFRAPSVREAKPRASRGKAKTGR
jgi:AcrR family transcriptional regulator